jgi:hypothetical protein
LALLLANWLVAFNVADFCMSSLVAVAYLVEDWQMQVKSNLNWRLGNKCLCAQSNKFPGKTYVVSELGTAWWAKLDGLELGAGPLEWCMTLCQGNESTFDPMDAYPRPRV